MTNIGKNTFSSKLNGVELWPFEVGLICIMYRFEHVLCEDFSMPYVNCSPNGLAVRLAWLASLACIRAVESTCEISSISSLVPDSPSHPTCLPDRARRLPDMSHIRHQASLANSM